MLVDDVLCPCTFCGGLVGTGRKKNIDEHYVLID